MYSAAQTVTEDAAPITWIDVGHLDDIPRRSARTVHYNGTRIALFRAADDSLFALTDSCPHRKGPLSDGIVHGHRVTCPLHAWVIELRSGQVVGPDDGCVETWPVRIEGRRVMINVCGEGGA